DEPTGNLDPDSREAILSMFDGFIRDGRTIVMVTHDPAAAERASRRLRLIDGTLGASDSVLASDAA
ncbi:MAG TPA: ABC transporter ATP-binding protein, partial [Schlesneria sp.]